MSETPAKIILSPEVQNLSRECDSLRDEVARLLAGSSRPPARREAQPNCALPNEAWSLGVLAHLMDAGKLLFGRLGNERMAGKLAKSGDPHFPARLLIHASSP